MPPSLIELTNDATGNGGVEQFLHENLGCFVVFREITKAHKNATFQTCYRLGSLKARTRRQFKIIK